MDDSKVKRYVCTRVLLEDGETFKPTHFRVVALGDYDDAMMRIGQLEGALQYYCAQSTIGSPYGADGLKGAIAHHQGYVQYFQRVLRDTRGIQDGSQFATPPSGDEKHV